MSVWLLILFYGCDWVVPILCTNVVAGQLTLPVILAVSGIELKVIKSVFPHFSCVPSGLAILNSTEGGRSQEEEDWKEAVPLSEYSIGCTPVFTVPPVIERYPKTLLYVVFNKPVPLVTFPVFPSDERRNDAPKSMVRKSLLWRLLQTPLVTSDVPPPLIVPLPPCCCCCCCCCTCCCTCGCCPSCSCSKVPALTMLLPEPNEVPKIYANRIIINATA